MFALHDCLTICNQRANQNAFLCAVFSVVLVLSLQRLPFNAQHGQATGSLDASSLLRRLPPGKEVATSQPVDDKVGNLFVCGYLQESGGQVYHHHHHQVHGGVLQAGRQGAGARP